MSREIPEFSARQAIEPGPLASSATVFDKLQNTFSAIVTQQAEKAGAKAGENLGFKPTLAITPATRAFNRAGEEANRYAIGSDVIENSNKLLNEFGTNVNGPESLAGYQKTYKAYANNLLSTVPVANRGYTKNLLLNKGLRGSAEISKKLQTQSTAEGLDDFYKNYTSYLNEMSNSAVQSNKVSQQSAVGYHGILTNMVNQAEAIGMIHQKAAFDLRSKADSDLQRNTIIGQYKAASNKLKFIQKFNDSKAYDKVFNPQQKSAITAELFGLNKKQDRIEGISNQDIKNQLDDLKIQARRGDDLDAQELTNVVNWAPEKEDEVKRQLNQEAEIGSQTRASQYDSLGGIQARISALDQPISAKEAAKPGVSELVSTRKAVASSLTNILHNTLKNPALAASNDPAVQESISKYDTENPFEPTQETDLEHEARRQNAVQGIIINNLRERGFPESKIHALTNGNALEIVGSVNGSGFEGGLNILNNLRGVSGKNWKFVYQSLVANGLNKRSQLAIGLQNIPKSEVNLGAVQESFNLSTKDIDTLIGSTTRNQITSAVQANSQMQSFLASMSNGQSQNIDDQANLINSVNSLAYVYYLKGDADGQGKGNAEDAAAEAYTTLLGNRYSTVTNNYRVPADVDPTLVRAMIDLQNSRIDQMDFKKLGDTNPALSASFIKKSDLVDAFKGGRWASDPTDQNRWVRMAVDGRPIKLANGQTWSFSTQDLADPQFIGKLEEQVRKAEKPALSESVISAIQKASEAAPIRDALKLFKQAEDKT